MRDLINMLTENQSIAIPRYWFRGVDDKGISPFSHFGPRVDATDLPIEIQNEVAEKCEDGHIVTGYDFRIRRTYDGMANWGFGVYVARTVDWAARYGKNILVCEVDPSVIHHINASDFSKQIEGTPGGDLAIKLYSIADYYEWSDQAAKMFKAVKTIKRDAKALFVQTHEDGDGQMCVFNKAAIKAKWVFRAKDD